MGACQGGSSLRRGPGDQEDVVDESKAEDDGSKKTKTESEKWIEKWTEFEPQTT